MFKLRKAKWSPAVSASRRRRRTVLEKDIKGAVPVRSLGEGGVMGNKIPEALREAGYEIYCDAEKLGSLDIPIVDFEIKKLIWNFDLPLWGKDNESWNLTPWDVINKVSGSESQQERVIHADMKYPILVCRKNGKWLIVDGVHRLVKAYVNGQKTILAKIVTEELIEKYPWTKESKEI